MKGIRHVDAFGCGIDFGLDRLRADEIAAMDHGLGAQRPGFAHRLRERIGAVVAARDDADFHARILAERA